MPKLTLAEAKKLYRLHNAVVDRLDSYRNAKTSTTAAKRYTAYQGAEDAFADAMEAIADVKVDRETGDLLPA